MLKIEDFHDFVPFLNSESFTAANDTEVQSKGLGTVKIQVRNARHNDIVEVCNKSTLYYSSHKSPQNLNQIY